jgi:calcyphosin
MFLTTQQITTLFNSFDLNKDKKIHYREFVETLRQDFNEKRLATVKYAYEVLSSQCDMSLASLESKFKAANHPRVRTREKAAETVTREFQEGMRSRVAGSVDEAAFIDYYADLNACLPSEKDEYFIDVVLSSWGFSQDSYITP